MGKYEHTRQFFSVAMPFYPSCLAPPGVTLCLHPLVSLFGLALPSCLYFTFTLQFTPLAVHSLVFLLLVYVFTSQSHSSCHLLYVFALLYFSC